MWDNSTADGAQAQLLACSDATSQQWDLDYLANGYYRLLNRNSGKALEVAGGPSATQDAAAIQQANWAHDTNQQWHILSTSDGWVRIEAHSGKVLAISSCGAGDSANAQQATAQNGNGCQQFRLQPLNSIKIANANSGKLMAVDKASMADG